MIIYCAVACVTPAFCHSVSDPRQNNRTNALRGSVTASTPPPAKTDGRSLCHKLESQQLDPSKDFGLLQCGTTAITEVN
jgi:hypothetical protein